LHPPDTQAHCFAEDSPGFGNGSLIDENSGKGTVALETITLTINDKVINCPSGISILQAARREGIKIPTLCDHPALESVGACRLCLVEDKGGRLMASCVTPASEGQVLKTDSPRVLAHRKNIVRLLLAEHPESCLVCNKGNRCDLRAIAASLGIGETNLYPMPHARTMEQANPFLVRDLTKCVLCGKCIRADHELVVVGAIDYNRRGFLSRPETVHERPLEESTCAFCGTCVSICPTGALSVKNAHFVGTPEKEKSSVCGFCGVGCSLVLGSAAGRIVEVNPADEPSTVNGPTLCLRGHFAHDYLHSENRLTTPRVRKNGELEDISWNDAVSRVAERLLEIREKHGPQSIGFLGSSKCTNEENYLFQKMARAVFRTNNLDTSGMAPARAVLEEIKGLKRGRRSTAPLKDLEKTDLLFVMGVDPSHSSPVLAYHLKRASRKGIPLVVVDPREIELARFATCRLQVRPATDALLLNGIAALLREGVNGRRYGDGTTSLRGFAEHEKQLASLDLNEVCRLSGVGEEALERTAKLLRGKRPIFVVGRGVFHQKACRDTMKALSNLSLLTGDTGSGRSWLYAPTYENNEAGAWDMGVSPDTLPGGKPLGAKAFRSHWERAWDVMLSPDPGLNVIRMIREAEKGNLKALYVMGENPVRALPQPEYVTRALENLEFLVVQDILDNETSRVADVILPGAAFSEKMGSFTNMEGRIQRFEAAVPPPGQSKPDLEIINLLLKEMGQASLGGSVDKLRKEIAKLIPEYGDLPSSAGEAWVREAESEGTDPQEEPLFFPIPELKSPEHDDAFPFTVILRSFRAHLGSGTRTSRSERVEEKGWRGEVEMSARDCESLGIRDGDRIRVVSPHGAVEREVKIETGLSSGLVVVPRAFGDNDAMNLFPFKERKESNFTGWITCPARVERRAR